ncbi:MAG: AbrB/MazE/SpoVT family DNA-binding domain-containing protein [Mariprofundaceae bacterium]
MLAKKTIRNQITLPKSIISHFEGVDYFDVKEDGGKIILLPVRPAGDVVRERLASLGLNDQDIKDAMNWARTHS